MPFDIGALGQSTAGGAAGGLMGLALGGINDRRQIKQQEKLNALQNKSSKEMMDYQNIKAMDMWQKTNYGAQVGELKKAGLNPALLYGMKGGGGVTTGNANSSSGGSQAPQGGGEAQGMMGMGLQTGMQAALIEAQRKLMDVQGKVADTQAGKNIAETVGQEIENVTNAGKQKSEIEEAKNKAGKTWAEWYKLGVEAEQIEGLLPGQKAKLAAEVNSIKAGTEVSVQQKENMKQQIAVMKQEVRESIQRIAQSNVAIDKMYDEMRNLYTENEINYAQERQINAVTENLLRTGNLLEYEKELQDKGLRNPLVQSLLKIVEGAAEGYGTGRGIGGAGRKLFQQKESAGFKQGRW